MANIRVETYCSLIDGSEIVFVAPCNCNEITGVKVYCPDGSKVFLFKDAHGNDLTGIGNLFSEGVLVKAILDVTNGYAYIQNADTNAYLEAKFKEGAPVAAMSTAKTLTAENAGQFLRVDAAATITVPRNVFPVGTEMEVFRNTSGAVKIAPASGVSFAIPGNAQLVTATQTVTDQYASVVLKQISDNVWSIQGAI